MHPLPYWRLSGYYFFYFAFVGAFSPYFGLYLQSLNFSAWDIGLLMSQMQLMRLVGPNVWGWLADRGHRRIPIVRLAGAVSLLGFTTFFWLQGLAGMMVAMTVMAFFWSAALPLMETLTFDHLRDEKGRYSRIRLWGSIGFILAVMGTGRLLDWAPLSSVLWVCWGVLAGILAVALTVPEVAALKPHEDTPGIGHILRQPRVRALLAACFAMSAAHGALYVFYSIHLADHGYNKTGVGLLWSLGVVAEIFVFLFMARLSSRYSLRAILLASFGAAVVRFLLIGWGVESILLTVLAQLMHGLTFGSYHAAAIAAVNQWFPGRVQGRGQAMYSSLSFGAGGLLGGLVSGWTWDRIGAAWTYTLSSAFALAGLLLILVWVRNEQGVDAGKE
ncbi:MAG TPA: major facilitator superfamily domain-containing protein 6 [Rhodocyclaceae bacterium]|nr:major facilitator superfamily domain-containing protein 6 [Rhodocyclaceae bacterium]